MLNNRVQIRNICWIGLFLSLIFWWGSAEATPVPAISPEICVSLQGYREGGADEPIYWEFSQSGTMQFSGETQIYVDTSSDSAVGCFYLTGVPGEMYDLYIKGDDTLSIHYTLTDPWTIYGRVDLTNEIVLVEGDADNDNAITIADQAIIHIALGTCEGDIGFDTRADLNEDGCVLSDDEALWYSNFDQTAPTLTPNPSATPTDTPSVTPSPSRPPCLRTVSTPCPYTPTYTPSPTVSTTPRPPCLRTASTPCPPTPTYTPSPTVSTTPRPPCLRTVSTPCPPTPTYTPSPTVSTTPRPPCLRTVSTPCPPTPTYTPSPTVSTTPRPPCLRTVSTPCPPTPTYTPTTTITPSPTVTASPSMPASCPRSLATPCLTPTPTAIHTATPDTATQTAPADITLNEIDVLGGQFVELYNPNPFTIVLYNYYIIIETGDARAATPIVVMVQDGTVLNANGWEKVDIMAYAVSFTENGTVELQTDTNTIADTFVWDVDDYAALETVDLNDDGALNDSATFSRRAGEDGSGDWVACVGSAETSNSTDCIGPALAVPTAIKLSTQNTQNTPFELLLSLTGVGIVFIITLYTRRKQLQGI